MPIPANVKTLKLHWKKVHRVVKRLKRPDVSKTVQGIKNSELQEFSVQKHGYEEGPSKFT